MMRRYTSARLQGSCAKNEGGDDFACDFASNVAGKLVHVLKSDGLGR
jgi:hypothetical protein